MYKISISASPHSSLYPHQAVFFGVLEYCIWFQIFRVSRVGFIRFDPTDVLAATESPFLQALKKKNKINKNKKTPVYYLSSFSYDTLLHNDGFKENILKISYNMI